MKTEQECLAHADEMRRRAQVCHLAASRADYLSMAKSWEKIAIQAAWQDAKDNRPR